MKSISRRERPSKPALTLEGIIAAALEMLGVEGLRKVTMRSIAAKLDTGPASLYVYVRNTEDLHAHILDSLLEPVTKPKPKGDWRQQIKTLVKRYMKLLFAHPEIARMAMSTMPSGAHYMALVNQVLGLLTEGGVKDQQAAWTVDLLFLYATATVVEHSGPSTDGLVQVSAALDAADPKKYPHIVRLRKELMFGQRERLEWHLDSILTGALRTK